MASLTALEQRLTRLERRVATTAPSRWAGPCALPPLGILELREVLKTLIVTAPMLVAGVEGSEERVKAGEADTTG